MEKTSEEIIKTIIIITIIVIIFAVFIFLFFLLFIKKKNSLKKENLLLKQAFEQELLKTQLETREETLNTVSKELHDNIGQLLNSTKLLIGVTQRSIPNPPETLDTANETLVRAIQELRALSKSLDKDWLGQFNFIENLEAEIKRLNAAKSFQIKINRHDSLLLKADQQIILFRIVQEILQNAVKHSLAADITIWIDEDPKMLTIIITDDGVGFIEKTIVKGSGILNIQYRTKLLGGEVKWQSAKGAGTIVTIHIPANSSPIL